MMYPKRSLDEFFMKPNNGFVTIGLKGKDVEGELIIINEMKIPQLLFKTRVRHYENKELGLKYCWDIPVYSKHPTFVEVKVEKKNKIPYKVLIAVYENEIKSVSTQEVCDYFNSIDKD